MVGKRQHSPVAHRDQLGHSQMGSAHPVEQLLPVLPTNTVNTPIRGIIEPAQNPLEAIPRLQHNNPAQIATTPNGPDPLIDCHTTYIGSQRNN
jgi:hypothetical protein